MDRETEGQTDGRRARHTSTRLRQEKLDVSYAKFMLKTKISHVNHIYKDELDKYFPNESI